jgi:Flp pilus assembly protein TadG
MITRIENGRKPSADFIHSLEHRREGRRGVAAVEFAIIAPVFLIMLFGIIEMGRAIMVQQIITNASREGARRAIVENATTSEVQTVVNSYLASTSVSSGVSVTVSPAPGPSVGFGDPVAVTVTVPFNNVSWLPTPWILGGKQLTATSSMRAERPE